MYKRQLHYQFPPWFDASPLNLDRVARLRERHPEDLVIVEMRNRSWAEPERCGQLLDLLSESRVSLCVVDEPQLGSGSFPRLVEVTDPRLAAKGARAQLGLVHHAERDQMCIRDRSTRRRTRWR